MITPTALDDDWPKRFFDFWYDGRQVRTLEEFQMAANYDDILDAAIAISVYAFPQAIPLRIREEALAVMENA